jgi:hypothetical protein
MGLMRLGRLGLGLAAMCCLAATAQERGDWRAASSTAKGVTGDVAFTETKMFLNFSGYTIAQIRSLTGPEMSALFHAEEGTSGTGSLYRTDIPGEKRFLHKNTLCGSEDVQWVATFVSGKTLQVALFSGAAMPKLTADDLANATNLCGTYGYVR